LVFPGQVLGLVLRDLTQGQGLGHTPRTMSLRTRAALVLIVAFAVAGCVSALGERELKAARHLCALVQPGPDAAPEVRAFCASVQPKAPPADAGQAGAGGASD